MSIVDRITQLAETQEFKESMTEWEPTLLQLGPTSTARLKRILTMSISEMTAYSDPMIKHNYNKLTYLAQENERMDRILSAIDLVLILAEGGLTLNAGTLARYAWLHEHCTDLVFKDKIKRTIDRLIELGNRYLYNHPTLLVQRPDLDNQVIRSDRPTIQPFMNFANSQRPSSEESDDEEDRPNQFTRIDLDAVRQSVYDLVDRYPGHVLFLEYLISTKKVDNMTPSSYKNQYKYYESEYSKPKMYTKVIEHNGLEYDFKIHTFQSRKDEFGGPEVLASAFGYIISGLNLITISRRKP